VSPVRAAALAFSALAVAACGTAPPLPPFPANHPGSPAAQEAPTPPPSDALRMADAPPTPAGGPAGSPAVRTGKGH
jgi:hypothetical protein